MTRAAYLVAATLAAAACFVAGWMLGFDAWGRFRDG